MSALKPARKNFLRLNHPGVLAPFVVLLSAESALAQVPAATGPDSQELVRECDSAIPGGDQFSAGCKTSIPGGDQFIPGGDQFIPGGDQFIPGGDQFIPGGDQFIPGGDQFQPTVEAEFPSGSLRIDDE